MARQVSRRVAVGPIVTTLVRLAEGMFGAGAGSFKKKAVSGMSAVLLNKLEDSGVTVPTDADVLVEELTEQAVELLNVTGEFAAARNQKVARPVIDNVVQNTAPPIKRKGGRPKGSKNKPKGQPRRIIVRDDPAEVAALAGMDTENIDGFGLDYQDIDIDLD